MQRLGGGAYRKKGGGNDPRCGCDMRVGWESSFGDVKQAGGACGACSAGLLPQAGGGCGCGLWKGGKRNRKATRKVRKGAGLLFANGGAQELNPAPVHFKNFGVTLSDTRADVSSIANYAGKGGAQDLNPAPVHFKNFGRTISNVKGQYVGGADNCDFGCPFKGTGYCNFYAKGGANYGEPMPLQAKLRGGGVNGCGCLTNPVIRGYTGGALISSLEHVLTEMNEFLKNYPPLNPGDVVLHPIVEQVWGDEHRISEKASNLRTNYNVNAAQDPQELELLEKLSETWDEVQNRLEQYILAGQVANQGGGYKGRKNNVKRGGGIFNEMEDVIDEINAHLRAWPPLRSGNIVTKSAYDQMKEDKHRLYEMWEQVNQNVEGRHFNAETEAKKEEFYGALHKLKDRSMEYVNAIQTGGYKPTKKNLKYLRRYKQGKSIGFTMKASLKAKGLIPRTSRKNRGKKIVSSKYK